VVGAVDAAGRRGARADPLAERRQVRTGGRSRAIRCKTTAPGCTEGGLEGSTREPPERDQSLKNGRFRREAGRRARSPPPLGRGRCAALEAQAPTRVRQQPGHILQGLPASIDGSELGRQGVGGGPGEVQPGPDPQHLLGEPLVVRVGVLSPLEALQRGLDRTPLGRVL
jgi:hypothetical protein